MKILKNIIITAAMLAAATAICFILRPLVPTDTHVPLIYVLAVLCVSRLTEGYFYGVLASMVAVVGVNYIFTYPYFQVDFTVTGYPLTFIVMLTVSISVSALMTQIKMQEHVRLKAEKERMRANLLRAVSHDIRTPLTSIEGAAAGIIDNKDVLTEEQKEELLLNIKEEAQWMVRMVENLLSITRMNDEGTRLTTGRRDCQQCSCKVFKAFPGHKSRGGYSRRSCYCSDGSNPDPASHCEYYGKCCDTWRNDDAGEGNHICE